MADLNVVVDLSHHNGKVNLAKAHIHDVTGVWPGLYSEHYVKELLGTDQDSVLANCWFWLSQYGPTAVVPPNWKTWTMWQYTDGGIGLEPHQVAGIGRCDRDKFNGDLDALQKALGKLIRCKTDEFF
jgi:lysozyme